MRDNPVSEEKLQAAAREYLLWELQKFDAYADYPEPEFHGSYKLQMAALRHDVKRGAIKEAEYRMGATFYIKRSIAAILLVFTMACLTMPETVLAGYQKLIEVIETVFEEYTEYRYRVNDVGAIEEEFRPLKLGYLPEGMEEVRRRKNEDSIDWVYMNSKEQYLNIYQKKISDTNFFVYTVDSVNQAEEYVLSNGEFVKLIYEENVIRYIGLYKSYRLSGLTNISKVELIKVLEKIEI